MMASRGRVVRVVHRPNSSGFTLFEVLAALAVLGIASGIFASLFIASMNLGHMNQSQSIAASHAGEQVVLLRNYPEEFTWPDFNALEPGAFGPVTPKDPTGDATSATDPPSVMPIEPRAFERERNFYDLFSWQAFARVPSPDAAYVEVASVVHWLEKGKPQSFTLTSAVPRAIVEEAR